MAGVEGDCLEPIARLLNPEQHEAAADRGDNHGSDEHGLVSEAARQELEDTCGGTVDCGSCGAGENCVAGYCELAAGVVWESTEQTVAAYPWGMIDEGYPGVPCENPYDSPVTCSDANGANRFPQSISSIFSGKTGRSGGWKSVPQF